VSIKHRYPASIDYVVATRSDKIPRVGDIIELGKQAYTVSALRVKVELRPVHDDDAPEYED